VASQQARLWRSSAPSAAPRNKAQSSKAASILKNSAKSTPSFLDKTGTLTFGTPELLDICPASDSSSEFLLKTAAIAESCSEHPIANAILRRAGQLSVAIEDPAKFHYTSGKGIIATTARNDEIIVGNQHFLIERGIQLTQPRASPSPQKFSLLAPAVSWAPFTLSTPSDPKPRTPSNL
jgi:cation transport ATPase